MADSKASSGPLSGLLVLDFTAFESGPLATVLMADQGARVIKVEPPSGEAARAVGTGHKQRPELFKETVTDMFQQFNRGKEALTLDLKDADDVALAKKIATEADVLFENFRPGVMEKLGLGYDTMRALNPSLIYVSVSGYGQFGEFAKNAAFDVVVQATSGLMSVTGMPDGLPTKAGFSAADATSAVFAYSACLTALYGREKTGIGSHVDVAMQDAMMMLQSDQISVTLVSGEHPERMGNEFGALHPFGVFSCKDDTQLALCIGSPHQFADLATAMGHSEWAEDFKFPAETASTRREEFDAVWRPVLATKTALEWKDVFDKARLPVNVLYDYLDISNSKFLQERKMVAEFNGMKVLGNPMKLGGYPDPADNLREAPTLGEHNDDIRKEFA
jgi:CoA:oxalate CoA-transferase